MLAIDESGDKALLGRSVRSVGYFLLPPSLIPIIRRPPEKISGEILFGPCRFHGTR